MSVIAKNQVFSAVHTIGGLLPADMLVRISEGRDVPGSTAADYGVRRLRQSVADEAERRWDELKSTWKEIRKDLPAAPDSAPPVDSTGVGQQHWALPLFQDLGFGLLPAAPAEGIAADDGTKSFAISHLWQHVPVHIVPWHVDLDRRPGGSGTVPPQSLLQEALNRSSAHLWGVLTNGRQVRLLRDSSALATASYVEFDLEAIFDGELFSEFVLLYRLLHASRFEAAADAAPSACWLETWRTEAITSGTRALNQLRDGVKHAITVLGTGFLQHRDNAELRQNLDTRAFHGALLRLVYRLLFLFVAEDRDALHPDKADPVAVERYRRFFSTARLRGHARRRRGTAHSDLYESLKLVLESLRKDDGRPELALVGLGGLFDDREIDAELSGAKLSNEALLSAVRHLAQVRDTAARRMRPVDYRNMGAEELGSVYESLLELVPKHSASERVFELVEVAGNDRKTTGSYYTPSSLIEVLLDTSLDPVIDDAMKRGQEKAAASGQPDDAEAVVDELLKLTVCDPACGSGHFLVAAARRIAKKVAAVREHNPEPTVGAVRAAMHEVVAHCIYGVDLNPMAVDLAKVSLWLEALEPGKPLSFLDAHVKHGNSLIGATPALLRDGIPDEAFKPIEGDDKKYARFLAKTNKEERRGQLGLFDVGDDTIAVDTTGIAAELAQIQDASDGVLRDVRRQEERYRAWEESEGTARQRRAADAWCAAFVWPKQEGSPLAVTHEVFKNITQAKEGNGAPFSTVQQVAELREQYRFFHWHLEFPDVFDVREGDADADPTTGWNGGFDCVVGNPPWEQVQVDAREFFASRNPEVAQAANMAERNRLVAQLKKDDPGLYALFGVEKRANDGFKHFSHASGRFPFTSYGRINTYSLFSEVVQWLVAGFGRAAQIVPSGIATDSFNQFFFKDLSQRKSISNLYDFENSLPIFEQVHRSFKFCIISTTGRRLENPVTEFAFFLGSVDDLLASGKKFSLAPEEIKLVNPNTGTAPIFRTRRDAEITAGIYRRVPVLVEEGKNGSNPWAVVFQLMFMMNSDSHKFETRESLEGDGWALEGNVFTRDGERMLPLYEAKMVHHYDHRWASYGLDGGTHYLTPAEKGRAGSTVLPRYWVPESDIDTGMVDPDGEPIMESGVQSRLDSVGWGRGWLSGWRDICRSTDERTSIVGFLPNSAVGHKFLLQFSIHDARKAHFLPVGQSSFCFDYVSRQKIGGTSMAFFTWKQLPVISPSVAERHVAYVSSRSDELIYTAYDMRPFAEDLGDNGEPFRWNEERRFIMRCELDALFFHLYGIERDDVDYIMETFPIVKRKDVAAHGSFRTKEKILEIYDRMAEAGVSEENPLVDGENFVSELDPPPGHGPRHVAQA